MNWCRASIAALLLTILLKPGLSAEVVFDSSVEVYRANQRINSNGFIWGLIGSPFSTPNRSPGVLSVRTNDAGEVLVHIERRSNGLVDAILYEPNGLDAVIAADDDLYFIGTSFDCVNSVPCADHVVSDVFSIDLDDAGNRVQAMQLSPLQGILTDATEEAGVFWGNETALLIAGEVIDSTGLAQGTTIETVDDGTYVEMTDTGLLLVSIIVNESDVAKRALLVLTINPTTGELVSARAVAKEGGDAGELGTWSEIASGPHQQAINEGGEVLFSAATSDGTRGVFLDGVLVAKENGLAPVNQTWQALFGQPLDISNTGDFAFRGLLESLTDTWDEGNDAGESKEEAEATIGSNKLALIRGTLDDAHDVDLYRIRIDDFENFSATTVPENGFTGAAFDTVVYVFADRGFNANGLFREGKARNDDAAEGVVQSLVDGSTLTANGVYTLGISTHLVQPLAGDFDFVAEDRAIRDLWENTPGAMHVTNSILYWPDPSSGAIERFDLATQTPLTPFMLSGVPDASYSAGDEFLRSTITSISESGSERLYYQVSIFGPSLIQRVTLDGSEIETLEVGADPIQGDATSNEIVAFATDGTSLFWSDRTAGELFKSDSNGANLVTLANPDLTLPPTAETFDQLAIDRSGGKLYWSNPILGTIERANLDLTSPETVASNVNVTSMVFDNASGTLYWSDIDTDSIFSLHAGTLAVSTLMNDTLAPSGIAVDEATGSIYWSSSVAKAIFERTSAGVVSSIITTTDTASRASDHDGWGGLFAGDYRFVGSPGQTSLPYEIKLSGASFASDGVMITKNNSQSIVMTGDTFADTAPSVISQVGATNSTIRISDSGNVYWYGEYVDTSVVDESAIFLDQRVLFQGDSFVSGLAGSAGRQPTDDALTFDISDDGELIVLEVFNGLFSEFQPSPDYVQGPLVIELDVQLPCIPDVAAPFGTIDGMDVQEFISLLGSMDPSTDLAPPFGVFGFFDLAAFQKAAMDGCP